MKHTFSPRHGKYGIMDMFLALKDDRVLYGFNIIFGMIVIWL